MTLVTTATTRDAPHVLELRIDGELLATGPADEIEPAAAYLRAGTGAERARILAEIAAARLAAAGLPPRTSLTIKSVR
jgi:hypothetical protein